MFIILAGPIPLRVREAQIPVVNDNECVRKINAVTEKIFILPASSFCAGGEEGHDACQVINKKDAFRKKYVNCDHRIHDFFYFWYI